MAEKFICSGGQLDCFFLNNTAAFLRLVKPSHENVTLSVLFVVTRFILKWSVVSLACLVDEGTYCAGSFLLIYMNEYHIPIAAYTFHGDQAAVRVWLEKIREAQVGLVLCFSHTCSLGGVWHCSLSHLLLFEEKLHTHTHTCLHTHMRTLTHMYEYTHTHMQAFTNTHACIHT